MTLRLRTHLLLAMLMIGHFGVAALWAAQTRPDERIAIYVGPAVRDGFIDVDRGILDSIRDIQGEIGKQRKALVVAKTPDAADVVLVVVRRGFGGPTAGVGVPVGALSVYLPVTARFVETTLRVGTYERTIVGEDRDAESWKTCAEQVIRDVMTWVEANRERLRK